jgi:glutamate-ammonia-ligase adenylyltransferase
LIDPSEVHHWLFEPVPQDTRTLKLLRSLGFADPPKALANFHSLTPTPRDAELLAPALPRLLPALAESPDPDMALLNLERFAERVDRAVLFSTLAEHPGAAHLIATLGGTSQFLADSLRRWPTTLHWLLDPKVMSGPRVRETLAQELELALLPFESESGKLNALRRFRYRELLRIALRDLLGDADLVTVTQELSHLADALLDQAFQLADRTLRARYGAPLTATGEEAQCSVIGMGKLGGEELNYSSDIDIIFVYSADGETTGGPGGRISTGEYFTQLAREIVKTMELPTEEGSLYRVDLRLRPEGRGGALVLSLSGFHAYYRERAELWERQALIKARHSAGDSRVSQAFLESVSSYVYQPGPDARIVTEIRAMKRAIDRQLNAGPGPKENVKLGSGGIREIEFLAQALQLLYGGADSWLRERHTLRAVFKLMERGYLTYGTGAMLQRAYTFLRTTEHRLQLLHEFQTHTLPTDPRELGLLARRMGYRLPPPLARRRFLEEYRRITRAVRRAFTHFFSHAPGPKPKLRRLPSLDALRATGFLDPERARLNLRLMAEGRPLVPYPDQARDSFNTMLPTILDSLWKSPDPDTALNQLEQFFSAVGARTAYLDLLARHPELLENLINLLAQGELVGQLLISQPELIRSLLDRDSLARRRRKAELLSALAPALAPGLSLSDRMERLRQFKQAEELRIISRMFRGSINPDQLGIELTALAEAAVSVAWLAAYTIVRDETGDPRDARGSWSSACIVGVGKFGGRELTVGSDLDLFVLYADDGHTDGPKVVENHVFYDRVTEQLEGLLGTITGAGLVFPVDLRLRPGSTGSALAHTIESFDRYFREWGELWERQSLVKARVVSGDPRLARRFRRVLHRYVYETPISAKDLKEIHHLRTRMEKELGQERADRFSVKLGLGGLTEVEFITQALQLRYGAQHSVIRRSNTVNALDAIGRAELLPADQVTQLRDSYQWLRRVITLLRLFGVRPKDNLPTTGPLPGRLARSLGYPTGGEFLADYRRITSQVRQLYREVFRLSTREE